MLSLVTVSPVITAFHSCCLVFVAASHQTRLDTRSKARRPIKVGIKGRGRSGTSRDSNPACQCCSSAHFVQCEPDEASSFTNPNVGPGTYASLRLKLDAWSSAVQWGQKCSSPTPKVAQPKLGAYSAPSLLLVSSTHPARMPDGPAKKPGAWHHVFWPSKPLAGLGRNWNRYLLTMLAWKP